MPELLAGAAGDHLRPADYVADFNRRFWQTDGTSLWKLERQQFFQEPGYDTWEAFHRDDWAESLRLLEASRPELVAEHRRMAEHGLTLQRVRVVEEPITAYLQWELHVLHLREQCGTGVRVVSPEQVAPLEDGGPLPELVTLDRTVLYEVIYDQHGVHHSARRYTDPELVDRCRQVIADLYAAGEPLRDYFARRVAPLPAPVGHGAGNEDG